ncbi:hypothetical protein PAPH110629_04420 [Paenibacillus phoenicis]
MDAAIFLMEGEFHSLRREVNLTNWCGYGYRYFDVAEDRQVFNQILRHTDR